MTGLGYGASRLDDEQQQSKDPMRFLLHALNQPLTGLQCVLELSACSAGLPQQCSGALCEALELTARMRLLVEAMQEVMHMRERRDAGARTSFSVGALVRDTLAEVAPVVESKRIQLQVLKNLEHEVCADRGLLSTGLFRLLDAALFALPEGDELRIGGACESGKVCLIVSYDFSDDREPASVSRQQLGILLSQLAFEAAGASWKQEKHGRTQVCNVRFEAAAPFASQMEVEK